MSNEDFEELDRIEHTIRSIQNILAEALKEADEKGSQSNNTSTSQMTPQPTQPLGSKKS
jgi:hypothetical protein